MNRRTILLLAGLVPGVLACEQGREAEAGTPSGEMEPIEEPAEQVGEAEELLANARNTLEQMQADPELWQLAQTARAVFVVPTYGEAGAVVGAQGGQGVLFAQQNGTAGDPIFYDVGTVNLGAQVGAAGGEIAMLLMSDEALQRFMDDSNFSITADAGLTIVDYSARAQATADEGTGDVILWSDMEGAFAGVTLGVTDIEFDDEENRVYYQRPVTPQELLGGSQMRSTGDTMR